MAIALVFGVLAGVLTWVSGPSKGILAVGKAGYLPPFFQKTNKNGIQRNILLIQGGAVTLLSLLFVVMPSVESFYQISVTVDRTTVPYRLSADVLGCNISSLHNEEGEAPVPHRKSRQLAHVAGRWRWICRLTTRIRAQLLASGQVAIGSNTVWYLVLIGGVIIFVVAPFIILRFLQTVMGGKGI